MTSLQLWHISIHVHPRAESSVLMSESLVDCEPVLRAWNRWALGPQNSLVFLGLLLNITDLLCELLEGVLEV